MLYYQRYSIQIDTITTRKYPNVSLEYLKFADLSKVNVQIQNAMSVLLDPNVNTFVLIRIMENYACQNATAVKIIVILSTDVTVKYFLKFFFLHNLN